MPISADSSQNEADLAMPEGFGNVYADEVRADAYARLAFPGTYYLAFRDLPSLIARHAPGRRALDFGCGTGRSTRFLRDLGFRVTGVDIAAEMLRRARDADPDGDYRQVADGDLGVLEGEAFALILSAFTFDNIATHARKVRLFQDLAGLLRPDGGIVNLVSAAEIYVHEWTSFSTEAFPENRAAKAGEVVRIVMLDVEDRRPVEDIFWPDEAYRDVYRDAGLEVVETHRPLGTDSEPYPWVSETTVSPWAIYVLKATE